MATIPTAVHQGTACDDKPAPINSSSMLGYDLLPGPRGISCKDYDEGIMAHAAAYDPRRFSVVLFSMTVLAGAVTILPQVRRAFFDGVGDTAGAGDNSSGLAIFLPAGAAVVNNTETNLEAGGYMVPPGAEGQLTSLQFSPEWFSFIPVPATPDGILRPATIAQMRANLPQIVRSLFTRTSVRLDYWEVTGKTDEKDFGTLDRWPAADGVSADDGIANNNAATGQTRAFPVQLKIHTMGPMERQSNERADNTTLLLENQDIVIPAPAVAADQLPDGTYVLAVRCEVTIDLVDEIGTRVDRTQSAKIAAQEAALIALQEQVAALLAARNGR